MSDDPRFSDYWAAIRADLNKQTVDAVIRLADTEQADLVAEVKRWKTTAAEFEGAFVHFNEALTGSQAEVVTLRAQLAATQTVAGRVHYDPKPQPGDGPEYHADLAFWLARHPEARS